MDRVAAERLDREDPLAGFREQFVIADDRIYLDGNSLGRLPIATRDRLDAVVEEWATELVGGWDAWLDAPRRAGDAIAPLIGAAPGEVICCDSVTVNLYKLAAAAHRGGPLVTPPGNFPTDRYVLEGLAAQLRTELRLTGDMDGAGLAVLSHVDYRTGALADMAALTAACPAPLIWDLSHSAGAVEVDLRGSGAQLAVGCTYKYLNAGPGGPAFLYVARELQPELRSPIWGWFAQADQFAMAPAYDPQPGIERFLAGTPPILGLAAAEAGARLTAAAGMAAIARKAAAQTQLAIDLAPPAVTLATPRRRGSHVALRHPDARALTRRLIDAGVVVDFREPDVVRLGIAPLYTRFVDVWDAMDRLARLV